MKNINVKWNVWFGVMGLWIISTIGMTPVFGDLWVSSSFLGSDSNPGTQNMPLKKISTGISKMKVGETLHVLPGTYNERFEITKNGTQAQPLRIVSETKWGAKILPTGDYREAIVRIRGNYVIFDGFEIAPGDSGINKYGVYITGDNVQFLNNKVHDINYSVPNGEKANDWVGSAVETAGIGDVVNGNVIYHVGKNDLDHGIYASEGDCTAMNNVVGNISGFALHTWHYVVTVKFINNTLFNCDQGAITIGNGDHSDGFKLKDAIIANNIIYNENAREHGDVIGAKWLNNLIFGGSLSLKNGSQSGTVTNDCMFVNFKADGTGDYHIKAGSAAIDKASDTYAPLTDADGHARVADPDIGAYEYVGTPIPVDGINGLTYASNDFVINQNNAVTVNYTASGARDLVFRVQEQGVDVNGDGSANTIFGQTIASVTAGTRSTTQNVLVNLRSPVPTQGKVRIVVFIAPVGRLWEARFDSDEIRNKNLVNPLVDSIQNILYPSLDVVINQSNSVTVNYTAASERDLVLRVQEQGVDINGDGNAYTVFGQEIVRVQAGAGTLAHGIMVNLLNPVAAQRGAQIVVFITPVGGGWAGRLQLDRIRDRNLVK